MIAHDLAVFRDLVSRIPDQPPPPLISEFVEGQRILPTNTPLPGPWHNARAPYLVEIMDNMSPYSPVQMQAIMKPRKVGLTTAAENVVAYWIKNPTDQMYVTKDEKLAQSWSTRKLPALLDSLGLRDSITATLSNTKSRRTGDTTYCKEYYGGALDIASAGSGMSRRAMDKRVLIIDEVDGVDALTTTGEGNWVEVLIGHTISWGARKKIMLFSSPTTAERSNIWTYYDQGDKRVFLVPCPVCGRLMELRLGDETTDYGLKGDTKAGELIEGYYLTECCHERVTNNQKIDMYSPEPRSLRHPERLSERARWEPTKLLNDPELRSYGMNSLYSPLGMLSFTDLYKQREKAIAGGPDAMRSYVNLYEGNVYSETGQRPRLDKVIAHRGIYARGTVPDEALYLAAGVDVQDGAGMDPTDPTKFQDPTNSPRLELEILGTGASYKTWSIDYLRFEGSVDDAYSGAWEKLYQFIQGNGFEFPRLSDGRAFAPQLMFVDSGNGRKADVVYQFAERIPNVYAIKGLPMLKADPHRARAENEGPKELWYRWANIGGPRGLYEINTRHYKRIIYSNLDRIPREPSGPQRAGFCDFPRDYDEHYFDMLTAEEQLVDGSFDARGRRNEALDCRVYAMCAADVWLDLQVQAWRKYYRDQGSSQIQVEQSINSKWVLDYMAAQLAPKRVT